MRSSQPVHSQSPRPRGRPRAYDADQALAEARDTFWNTGYSGTSLDDLVDATGMNRPSLYGAFGDKHRLYLRTLDGYRELGRSAMKEELSPERPLEEALRAVFARAIAIYITGSRGARGCYLIGTAATEAVLDSKVRTVFAAGLHELDDLMEARLRDAVKRGELSTEIDPAALARVLCGVMNSLALRARAGDSRETLEATADAAVHLVVSRRT
jgi:TetR/AcrR family transcriptional regulator, copper-responsive repressor